jgi:hypothetical protein
MDEQSATFKGLRAVLLINGVTREQKRQHLLVTLDVVRDVGGAVSKRRLVENAKAFVDGVALLLHFLHCKHACILFHVKMRVGKPRLAPTVMYTYALRVPDEWRPACRAAAPSTCRRRSAYIYQSILPLHCDAGDVLMRVDMCASTPR